MFGEAPYGSTAIVVAPAGGYIVLDDGVGGAAAAGINAPCAFAACID